MRSDSEKNIAIEALKKQRDSLPKVSMFGNNNYEEHNAAIAVITEDLDEDEIYDRYEEDEYHDLCLNVRQWLDGGTRLDDFVDEKFL